jgi:RNA polymerase sigma-32 factor
MGTTIEPAVARYIARVTRSPALTRDEELRLARAFLAGDRAAGERVIAANLRHVVPCALRYRRLGVPLGELIAQGNLGLMLALRRFDPEHGLRFSTYANHWVRSEILALARKAQSVVARGRRARVRGRDASLDADAPSALPACAPEQEWRLGRARTQRALAREVDQALAALSARERYVVEHRLLADPEARHSLAEIGTHFGVSRERARQIEARIKQRLRSRLQPLADGLAWHEAA